MSKFGSYLLTAVKGACMGAADVIPGVSGGTIAFMMGIYDELLGSISSINSEAFRLLFKGQFKAFWKHINGNFLLSLFLGIGFSILSLAKIMTYLLVHHPVQTWAFFFGLIVASSLFILRDIKGWNLKSGLMLVLGIALGAVICTLSPTQTPDHLWFIFLCGAIAICAMILPGISGSFILLIMGKYEFIMTRISELTSGVNVGSNLLTLLIFGIGALIGIISFSKFLHWLLNRYHQETLLVLAGFIIGSLVKVWPWSDMEVVTRAGLLAQGQDLATAESTLRILSSQNFPIESLAEMHYAAAALFCGLGILLVCALEYFSHRKQEA